MLQLLRAAQKTWRIDPDRVALAGISQGGHGAWIFGARHPGLWSCLVPVCGYGRAHTVASRAWRLPVWAFHGLKDDVVDPRDTQGIVAELARRKREAGLPEPQHDALPGPQPRLLGDRLRRARAARVDPGAEAGEVAPP